MLIGSMSMNLIAIKQDFARTMRSADQKIALLKEVVEKIQRGEAVDVEKALGAGDPERELEWEERKFGNAAKDQSKVIATDVVLSAPRRRTRGRNPRPNAKKTRKDQEQV